VERARRAREQNGDRPRGKEYQGRGHVRHCLFVVLVFLINNNTVNVIVIVSLFNSLLVPLKATA
jgi:hypothetical protein